ncbi:nitrite transporter [Klebsiella pneumoniae]|uniref:Nitrite transporter n=1 Tax=Klebsiella pneumoniae TaxID=573 RepID=A0A378C9J2_KLEPN|nr:nitrite transporter [Klebsiella pneumoniae]
MFNPDKYRSVTWLKGGRVYPATRLFRHCERDTPRPEFYPSGPILQGSPKTTAASTGKARRMMLTLERCEPCEGAGVACYSGSTVTHVGIVVSIGGLLHVAEMQPGNERHLFCRCRGLSGDLSKWSSGNDHSFFTRPGFLGEPLETHEHGVTSIRSWLVANVEGYEDRDVPPLTVEVEGLLIPPGRVG